MRGLAFSMIARALCLFIARGLETILLVEGPFEGAMIFRFVLGMPWHVDCPVLLTEVNLVAAEEFPTL